MHVIGHHALCIQVISNPIEVSQSFRHLISYGGVFEKAATGSCVQLLFNLFAEEHFESISFERRQSSTGGFRGCCNIAPLKFELPEHRLRERVCQAKRNEVDGVALLPVREFAAAANGRHSGIVIEKSRRDAGVTEWPPRPWFNPRSIACDSSPVFSTANARAVRPI
jgi:hypothetical protein